MSLKGPLLLALACLYTMMYMSQGMDLIAYKRIMDTAMAPRVEGQDNEDIKKAITELVIIHFNIATGRRYTLGSATGFFSGKRRKRFASGFGSGWNSGFDNGWGSSGGYNNGGYNSGSYRNDPWSNDPWGNNGGGYNNNNNRYNNGGGNYGGSGGNYGGSGGNYGGSGGSYGGNSGHHGGSGGSGYGSNFGSNFGGSNKNTNNVRNQIIHCPVQSNQSAVYQLNATGTDYPATEIGNELFIRSQPGSDLFFFCLVQAAVTPHQSPQLEVDQNFVSANQTCPSESLILFSYQYQNTAFGGRCWIVQGFGEIVEFNICLTKSCVNCKLDGHEKSSGYQQWNSNSHHPNDYNNNHHHPHDGYNTQRNVTVNQCLTEYRVVQVISYCERLPVNQRIVYDRIIVPLFCNCKSIDCMIQNADEIKHYKK